MNILSRLKFPHTVETADLYIKLEQGSSIDFHTDDKKVILNEGSSISFNTYFNSIYENFYTKYTTISLVYYLLKLEGDFEVSIYRETNNTKEKPIIYRNKFKQCQLSSYVQILLPDFTQSKEHGRIYLEINCLSKQGLFTEGLVVTNQEKDRDVALSIITCTFKKEVYVKNTVNTILQDKLLQDKNFKVFIVDNGKTLEHSDFVNSKLKLISHRNVGGSGGFTKGLVEALQEGVYTHFLFMDDDIELDTESIYRLFSLYEYAKQDFAVAGSMLDLYKKHILYEAGALYRKEFDDEGNYRPTPFMVTPLKNQFDLQKPSFLNLLLVEDNIEYGGFWFFSFSQETIESVGLPLPFFIKVDDMEFGLRIKEHLVNGIVAFPSLAVWHEPFYAKKPVWDTYYIIRNHLITDSIHGLLGYWNTVKYLTKRFVNYLLIFDYNSASLLLKGFEDYMQGSKFLKETEPEILHSTIVEISKMHKTQKVLKKPITNPESYRMNSSTSWQKFLSLLTLNSHLIPNFLLSKESVVFNASLDNHDSHCKAFAKEKVILVMDGNPYYYENHLDKVVGIKLLFSWFKSTIKSIFRWSNVSADWKNATKDLTSIHFWKDYLEPKK